MSIWRNKMGLTKDELILEVKRYKKLYEEEKHNCAFLIKQQRWLTNKAQEAGSKFAKVNHEYIRLKEVYEELKKRKI